MANTFYERRYKIEDDVNGLVAVQKRCYITGASPRNCSVHEWLVPRSCGLPKRFQSKIFAICNMVMVEINLHDQGLNAIEDLFLCAMKVRWHGRSVVDAFIAGLEMRTVPTLDQWIEHRYQMAAQLIADGWLDDISGKLHAHHYSSLYLKWISLWMDFCNTSDARPSPLSPFRSSNIGVRSKPVLLS